MSERELPLVMMNADGECRALTLIEELIVEGGIVEARRGWLYRTAAEELARDDADLATLRARADALQKCVDELCACKDLKDTMPNAQWYPEAHLLQTNEYQRRKPLVWSAAMALRTRAKEGT